MSFRPSALSSAEALSSAFESCPDGVVVVDRRGLVVFANPAAMRLMRPEGAALVGTAFGRPLTDADLAEVEFEETGAVAEIRVSRLVWEGGPARLVMVRDLTGRRHAAGRNEARRALLEQAERVVGLGSYELDLRAGRITYASGMQEITGHDLGTFTADPYRVPDVVVHPDDRAGWHAAEARALAERAPVDEELRIVRPDGEVRIVRWVVAPRHGSDGALIKVYGTVQDVTEQRRAEEARRRAYRLLGAIADNTPAVIYVKDREGRYMFVNAALAKAAGHSREELETLTAYDMVPRESVEVLREHELQVLATGVSTVREETLERAGGQVRTWLTARFPIVDEDGKPYAVGVVGLDVTEENKAREALRQSEERLRLLTEHSPDVVILTRLWPKPRIEYANPAVRTVLGAEPEELIGDLDTLLTRVHPDDRALAEKIVANPGHFTDPVVTTMHRWDGSTFWAEVRATPIRDQTGRITAVECNIRDITRRVEAEQERERLARQMEQAERLETLGRLAGGVAHDINNLLAIILGTAELLADDFDPADERVTDVERISKAAQRGAALTRQLLIFSRREPSIPELLDLNEVIAGIEDIALRTIGADVEFGCSLQPELKAVKADRARMEQVVINLMLNARQAMPDGGRIIVTTDGVTLTEERTSPSGNLPPVPPGEYVRLTVTDTGEGMTDQVARRAFEPFFTTRGKNHGNGLGLATVHGAVAQAGGSITLDTRPGEGTTLRVYLPAVAEQAEKTPAGKRSLPQGRGETVLVVEDEEPVRQVITRILSRNNYQVITADSAEEAVRICDRPGTRIDLLLTDVIMPGMTGFQLGERLRTSHPGMPILYMSGYADGQRPGDQDNPTNHTVLGKPFETATVLQQVHETLHTNDPSDPQPN